MVLIGDLFLMGLYLVCLCLIFKKFGYAWWKALIPFYNLVIKLRIVKLSYMYLIYVFIFILSAILFYITTNYDVINILASDILTITSSAILITSALAIYIIFQIVFVYRLARILGETKVFRILSLFFSQICLIILAVGKRKPILIDENKEKKKAVILIVNIVLFILITLLIVAIISIPYRGIHTVYGCMVYDGRGNLIEDKCVTETFEFEVEITNTTDYEITESDLTFSTREIKLTSSQKILDMIDTVQAYIVVSEDNLTGEPIDVYIDLLDKNGELVRYIVEEQPDKIQVVIADTETIVGEKKYINKTFENVPIEIYNLDSSLEIKAQTLEDTFTSVTVTGETIQDVNEGNLVVYIDLMGYGEGTHNVKVEAQVENSSDNLSFDFDNEMVTVILEKYR